MNESNEVIIKWRGDRSFTFFINVNLLPQMKIWHHHIWESPLNDVLLLCWYRHLLPVAKMLCISQYVVIWIFAPSQTFLHAFVSSNYKIMTYWIIKSVKSRTWNILYMNESNEVIESRGDRSFIFFINVN